MKQGSVAVTLCNVSNAKIHMLHGIMNAQHDRGNKKSCQSGNKNLNYHNYRNFKQLQAIIISKSGNDSCLKLLEVAIVVERRKIDEV